MRRFDGVYRYFLAHALPVFSEDGNILEWVGTCIDITERKQIEDIQKFLAQSGMPASGEDFFKSLARYLAENLGMDFVCIDRLLAEGLSARTEATYFDGDFEDNLTYTLKDTPWDSVVGENICCFPAGVRHLYPKDELLQGMMAESYAGTVLWSSKGQPIGLIAVIGRQPLTNPHLAVSMLKTVAVRAAGELERREAEEALRQRSSELQQLSETLDLQVRERTAELTNTNEELRRISGKLLSAHEEERKRVSREIHDSLGSHLSAIKFKTESTIQKIEKNPMGTAEQLASLLPLIQEGIEECRRIQTDLRPPMLDDLGLLPTLSWFFRRFQTVYSSIRVEQEIDIEEEEVPNPLKIVVFRVIQEAMNNITKYSQADLVRQFLRRLGDKTELVIRDNGRGFNPEEVFSPKCGRKGLGLTSMKERVELSGGSFSIESAKGKGTVIRAVWPI
jgi:signal transduction histidine kinase